MAEITFTTYITDEACTQAREAIQQGWHLTPDSWEVSADITGAASPQRTYASRKATWASGQFSAIAAVGTNKLMHTIEIPPNAYSSITQVAEIYFIYKNYNGVKFLFAISKPTTPIEYRPGVSQGYSFVFGLNNTTVDDLYNLDYTYPQDIADHNISESNDIHTMFLKKDGTRTATGILKYDSAKTFTTNLDIVNKQYVDAQATIDNVSLTRVNGAIRSVGNYTINNNFMNEWIGTASEYDTAVAGGLIGEYTTCYITDD